jgi:predicted TIM-barrel fold metal-dependent hydrolase
MPSRPDPDAAPLASIEGAWDCHLHVFGPRARYPLAPARRYEPGEAALDDARAHAHRIGVRRLVFVQASPYGDDNRCLLDTLAAFGPDGRGVVSVPASALDDAALADLAAAGVRGVRLNPKGRIGAEAEVVDALKALRPRLRHTGWHVEINSPAHLVGGILASAAADDVPLVFDHLMGLDLGATNFAPALDAAARLISDRPIWAKLSGATRAPPSPRVEANRDAAIRRLIECAPDRIVWGSDWPHTPLADGGSGFRAVDDVQQARDVLKASGAAAERVFRLNPGRLFA